MNDEAVSYNPTEPAPKADPKYTCDYCGLSWGLGEPPPLTNMCEHGGANHKRVFADVVRFSTLPDGRVLIQLDMPPAVFDGMHVCCLIDSRDAERLRVKFGKSGAAALAERYRA